MPSRAKTRMLQDPEAIRQWAEERGARPAAVSRTGGGDDVGIIRLDFPGYSGEGSLEPISWEEFFSKFEETGLALLVQDETASGERSNFNKLVKRETAKAAGISSRHRSPGRSRSTSKTRNRKASGSKTRTKRSAGTRATGNRSKRSAGPKRSSGRRSASAKSSQRSRSSSSKSKSSSTKSRSVSARKSSNSAGKRKQVRSTGRGRGSQSSRKAA